MAKSALATTPTWKISQLERETIDNFVFTAHYLLELKDDTHSAGAYGSINFERPKNLIPYSDLTESEVIGWVQDALGAEKVAEVEAALQAQLDEQRNPSEATGIPW
jgi:hypothetical protein